MTIQSDRDNLEHFAEEYVNPWLRERGVPPTVQNVIHALADTYQLDWLGGDEAVPECLPITWWQAFKGLFG